MFFPLLDTLTFDQHMLFFSEMFSGFSFFSISMLFNFNMAPVCGLHYKCNCLHHITEGGGTPILGGGRELPCNLPPF